MKAKPLHFGFVLCATAHWVTGCETKQQTASGLPAVEFVQVVQKDVPITKEWVATLDGLVVSDT